MARTEKPDSTGPRYRIGTVAQLTGLPPDTIRAWERRYATVSPGRSEGGTRLYSEDDVARLQLMKALTECGEAIGAIAGLANDELRRRLARHTAGPASPEELAGVDAAPAVRRIAVLDPGLAEQLRANEGELGDVELALASESLESFLGELGAARPDVLVVHLAALGADPEEAIERCVTASGAGAVVAIYDFAPRRQLARLAERGVRLIRGPVRVALLRRTVLDFLAVRRARGAEARLLEVPVQTPLDERQSSPARLYSDAQLARLREVHSSVQCECPNHLASLVMSLVAFEHYSEKCLSESPEDAELHHGMGRTAGHARSLVEKMLARVCEHDGIRV